MTLFAFGCEPRKLNDDEVSDSLGGVYLVVEIEGCEYLKMKSSEGPYYVITHKGNCKNPIHYGLEKK